eukprot:6484182-Amphidinium_carterae.2
MPSLGDGVALERHEEAEWIHAHWEGVFGAQEGDVEENELLNFVVEMPWEQVVVSQDNAAAFIKDAPKSSPGPDGMSYQHLAPLADEVAKLAVMVYDGSSGTEGWPVGFHDTFSAFIPKQLGVALDPSQLRPLSLKNTVAKVLPAVLGKQLSVVASGVCHVSQYGGIATRTIAGAFAHLERLALQASRDSRFSFILKTDIRTAFPSMKRGWILRVLRQSGANETQLSFVRCLLHDNPSLIKWAGKLYRGFVLRTGLLQGCPLSMVLFALGLDPWIRFVSWTMPAMMSRSGGVEPIVVYADDGTMVGLVLRDLVVIQFAYGLLHEAMGLAVNGMKTQLMPLGAITLEEFQEALASILPPGGPFAQLHVVAEMRWLGISLSRGSFQPHRYAVEKIVRRGELMKHSKAGSAGNLYIGNLAILSTARHTLRLCQSNAELQSVWDDCLGLLIPGHARFLPDCLPRLRDLFGLPCNVPLIEQVQLESQLRVIEKLPCDPRVLLADLGHGFGVWLDDAFHGWRTGGCLASWVRTLQKADELGIARVRRVGALNDTFVSISCWLKVRRGLTQLSITQAKAHQFIEMRVSRDSAAENVPRFLHRPGCAALILASCRLVAHRFPARAVALLRLLLGGLRAPSRHAHGGSCCFCLDFHTGHHVYAALARGCYRKRLAEC